MKNATSITHGTTIIDGKAVSVTETITDKTVQKYAGILSDSVRSMALC